MEAPEAYLSHPPAPNCYRSSVQMGYGEDAFEGRTTLGEGASWRTVVGRVRTETFSAAC